MTRVNDRIRAPKIRVVYGEDSQQLGVMTTREAVSYTHLTLPTKA